MGLEYGDANHMRLKCLWPSYARYMYIDTNENRADALFIRAELPVVFENDMTKVATDYKVVICRVKKRDEGKFLECMANLKRAISIEGRGGYREFCRDVMELATA